VQEWVLMICSLEEELASQELERYELVLKNMI
jgi:hypothetical protein